MFLQIVERRGVGRTSLRMAVPGAVLGLAIGLTAPLDRLRLAPLRTR